MGDELTPRHRAELCVDELLVMDIEAAIRAAVLAERAACAALADELYADARTDEIPRAIRQRETT